MARNHNKSASKRYATFTTTVTPQLELYRPIGLKAVLAACSVQRKLNLHDQPDVPDTGTVQDKIPRHANGRLYLAYDAL